MLFRSDDDEEVVGRRRQRQMFTVFDEIDGEQLSPSSEEESYPFVLYV